MNKLTFTIASLGMVVAGSALAQSPANPTTSSGVKPPHTQFSSLDTNKDGRISKDEIKANADLTASFADLDADHDGYLSENEYAKWKASPNTMAPAGKPAGSNMPAHPDGVTAPASDSGTPAATPKDSGGKY